MDSYTGLVTLCKSLNLSEPQTSKKELVGRGYSLCKGPEAGQSLTKSGVLKAQCEACVGREGKREEGRQEGAGRGLVCCRKDLGAMGEFRLSEVCVL